MAWMIGIVGIVMGTLVVALGGNASESRLALTYRKLGVFLLVSAVFLLFLTLVNDLVLAAS